MSTPLWVFSLSSLRGEGGLQSRGASAYPSGVYGADVGAFAPPFSRAVNAARGAGTPRRAAPFAYTLTGGRLPLRPRLRHPSKGSGPQYWRVAHQAVPANPRSYYKY